MFYIRIIIYRSNIAADSPKPQAGKGRIHLRKCDGNMAVIFEVAFKNLNEEPIIILPYCWLLF